MKPKEGLEDFLDDAHLLSSMQRQMRRSETGEPPLRPEEIRYAALCLMLNPNAYWARMKLIYYALDEALLSDKPVVLAATAVTATRLARGIYRYDRYKGPLKSFIYYCYRKATLDVCALAPAGEVELTYRQLAKESRAAPLRDMRREDPAMVRWRADLFKKADNPQGRTIKLPLKKKENGAEVPVSYFLLHMSSQELEKALELLRKNGTPLEKLMPAKKTAQDRLDEISGFFTWYGARTPVFDERDVFFIKRYHVQGTKGMLALANAYTEQWPDRQATADQAHHVIYARFRKEFKKYLLEEGKGREEKP